MATVTQKSYSDIIPITFNLRDRDRSLDLCIPSRYSSQQGGSFLEYEFLTNINDVKNKNYTSNYLTDTKTEAEIFDLNFDQNINNSFITTIKFNNDDNKYLTISKNNTSLSSQTTLSAFSAADINPSTTQSFVIDLSSGNDNGNTCQIWTYDGLYKKYLVQRGVNQTIYPDVVFDTLNDNLDKRAVFDIVLDGNTAMISFYGDTNVSTNTAVKETQYIVGTTSSRLTAISGFDAATLSGSSFSIQNYNTIDTSYSDYSNTFVYYTSGTAIDSSVSLPDQSYNFLLYNNYEENYLSGNNIYGQLSYFNLKNQISNNNHVNKRLPFALPQQHRYYTSILNNETSEVSDENLKLGYNFYTTEFKFDPDKYTKFVIPDNITPFKSININDANFQAAGAYAAGSPYYSDRIYKLQDESNLNTRNEENGTFLCSWLYDDNDKGIWYDRYYLPKFSTPLVALSGTANPYTTQIENISSSYGLGNNNMYYYDIVSTMSIEPNNAYYYARIGKNYVSKTLMGLTDKVIKSNFNINSTKTESIITNQNTIFFDGTVYDEFTFPSLLDADQGALSMSFCLNTPSIQATKAHQLIGNLYNTGISIIKNFYFTPFVILANGNALKYYDNDFNLVRTTAFNSISAINDVCYMTQSGDMVLICESSNGAKILRVNYNGDIIRESSHSLAVQLATSGYTSRVFYGVGSRAMFFSPTVTFNLDLQTLSIDLLPASTGESGVLSAVGTPIGAISGTKGVNIDGIYAASLSAATGPGAVNGSSVLFTEYNTGEQFNAINSVNSRIWDINAFDDKLYIQSDKLYVFNTERELLSTINLSTSAVSGYKIDFVSEDYTVNPIVFSLDANSNLIVDKIITTENNTVSTYSLGISSTDIGWAHEQAPGRFTSPTNLHSLEDTFKTYEDKFCFVSRFDNEKAAQDEKNPWDTFNQPWSGFESGNWNVNYTGTGATLVDNSSVHIIEGIRDGHNCISLDLDLVTGMVRVFIDGTETTAFTINAGIKPLKNYLYNNFYIGAPNFSTGSILDYKPNSVSLARNAILGNINVFDTTLDIDILKYLYLNCTDHIDSVNFDITTSARNNTETINSLYTYKIPGNLSNKIKLLIKNGNLNLKEQAVITDALQKRISRFLPATVNISDVEFDYSIGNEQQTGGNVLPQLQPSLPGSNNNSSNVFDPGQGGAIEVTTKLQPVLFDSFGEQAFITVV